jgi:hypothetical protein
MRQDLRSAEDVELEVGRVMAEFERTGLDGTEQVQSTVSAPDAEAAISRVRAAALEVRQRRIAEQIVNESPEVRAVIENASARYVDRRPRSIKRCINSFRMQLLVYNRTQGGILAAGADLDVLARWSALQSRWPGFAEESRRDIGIVSAVTDWLGSSPDLANPPEEWPDNTRYLIREDRAFRNMFTTDPPLRTEDIETLPIVR